MQRVLKKRVLRDLKSNAFRYFALSLMIILGMYLVVSIVGAADTVVTRVDELAKEHRLEDGEFTVFVPLTNSQEQGLMKKGITLEKIFSLDYVSENKSTIRVFENRENINLLALEEGKIAKNIGEAVIEKRYSQENGLGIGDRITIADKSLEIVGICTVPDYDGVYKELSDSSIDSKQFGLAFVNEKQYSELKELGKSNKSEEYTYAYRHNGKMTNEQVKEYFDADIYNLTRFLEACKNPRIKASSEDQVINKAGGLIAGIIVMILFTYVISVFVIHKIEEENSIIGALYALGAKKRDLIIHYLTLPVAITLVSGVIGTIIGFSRYGINVYMTNCYNYFSLPKLETVYPIYLIVYGTIMPPVIAAIVNCAAINKRLSQPVLKLIKNEQSENNISNINLGNLGFIQRFCIRQMLREARTGFTVIFGMFIAMIIMMMGLNCYVMCQHVSVENKKDTKYEYMYTYKYPTDKVPNGGEACYIETLSKEVYGYDLDITLLGIDKDNPYFDIDIPKEKNKVIISTALSQKYNLNKGDKLVAAHNESYTNYSLPATYAFSIEGVMQYSTGLYAFMNIDSMRELFGQSSDYYNAVFSDKELDIEPQRLYSVVAKEDISKASDVFIEKMFSFIIMLVSVSAVIFCVVMYLMMKVMIERSAYSISLIKIFGYRIGEIRKLYLNGNFYIVAVGAAICIPLSKIVMDAAYPMMISNVAIGMNLTFSWQLYVGIYIAVIIIYLIINQLLVRKLKKMVPAEVLKNRE